MINETHIETKFAIGELVQHKFLAFRGVIFDIDPSLPRLWDVLDNQKQNYRIEAHWKTICYDTKNETLWQPSWFPACTNVFCFRK